MYRITNGQFRLAIHKKQPKLNYAKMELIYNVDITYEQRRTENEKTRSIFARIA